jgi:hypothetical protein
MKQAILITAYKNIDQLLNIMDYFNDSYTFYIHIDKKSKIDTALLQKRENVSVFSEYTVHWGGVSHLKTILFLAAEALKKEENTFFHLITGEDYPAKTLDYFEKNLDKSKDYIRTEKMPRKDWHDNGGFDRIDYYNPYDLFNAKNNVRFMNGLVRLQKKLRIKRSYPASLPQLYGGSTYWSLTRDTLQQVIDYTQTHPELLHRMKHTFCSEEIYFQTVIMHSSRSGNGVNDNLRYIDWVSERGGRPAFLDSNDFPDILASDKIFARKLNINNMIELKTYINTK